MERPNLMKKILKPLKPEIIRFLEDKIGDWGKRGGLIWIVPKEDNFDLMFIRKRSIGFFSSGDFWEFISRVVIVPEGKMRGIDTPFFQRMKSLEVELHWDGFRNRKPLFKPSSGLLNFKKQVTWIMEDDALQRSLNSDTKLMDLVREVQPDEIRIKLFTSMESQPDDYFLGFEEKIILDFINKPTKIWWIITIVKDFGLKLHFKTEAHELYQLTSVLAGRVRDISANYREF